MTTTSTAGGVLRNRGGDYSLNLREKGVGIRLPSNSQDATIREAYEALKRNGIFVANLSKELKGLGKDIVSAMAATSLITALDATKHDSSRAAANWDLAITSSAMSVRSNLDPLRYRERGDTYGKIGGKHSRGRYSGVVKHYKQQYYGIEKISGIANLWMASNNGRLYNAIGVGRQGTPRVDLFNPIAGNLNVRRAGDQQHRSAASMWHSYAYYAFGGESALTFLPGLETARDQIGNAFIPARLLSIEKRLKTVLKHGGIPRL